MSQGTTGPTPPSAHNHPKTAKIGKKAPTPKTRPKTSIYSYILGVAPGLFTPSCSHFSQKQCKQNTPKAGINPHQADYLSSTISVNRTKAPFVGRCGSISPSSPTFRPTNLLKFFFEAEPFGKAQQTVLLESSTIR